MDHMQPTQKGRRMSRRHPIRVGLTLLVGGALLLVGIFAGAALATLNPPTAFVLAADGTQLSLEAAGILLAATTDGKTGGQWATLLGKSLFWDEQTGSDGNACASCHFMAGADLRIRNQLHPGFNDVAAGPGGDTTFGSTQSTIPSVALGDMPSGAKAGANYTLVPEDFPLHQLADKKDRNSPIKTTTNDAISSLGAFAGTFTAVKPGSKGISDKCEPSGEVFNVGKLAARQVEPRNTPTTINAAFFHANFWDGRAKNLFNGVGVFGMRDILGDPNKRLIILENGVPKLGYLEVRNASLASQAVGPPLSVLEMSCEGRTFADVGRKLLSTIPLLKQQVSNTDSVLGPYVGDKGQGLQPQYVYAALIMRAFDPKYWAAPGRYRIVNGALVVDPTGYTQMEINFSMFWGLSIMLYEQTLISDQSRFDDWFASCRPATGNPSGLTVPIGNPVVTCLPAVGNPNQSLDPTDHGFTELEVLGFGLFNNGGTGIRNAGNPSCAGCHGAIANPRAAAGIVFPVFSEAAFQAGQNFVPVERSRIDDVTAFGLPPQILGGSHDRGFFSLGLRRAANDLVNGGFDPYGNPLSLARMFLREQAGLPVPETTGITNRCNTPTLIEGGGTPAYPGCVAGNPTGPLDISQELELVDGTVKTPSIRNVGLTPPYFHYGGYSDLRSVVEVYARGGSKRNMALTVPDAIGDWSGTGPLGKGPAPAAGPVFGTNVDFFIRDIKSTDEQIDALVAFMLTATDSRVQCDKAPFDHPSLTILNGHKAADQNKDGKADDITFTLPAVGAAGYNKASGFCIPNAGDLFEPGMQSRAGGLKVPLP